MFPTWLFQYFVMIVFVKATNDDGIVLYSNQHSELVDFSPLASNPCDKKTFISQPFCTKNTKICSYLEGKNLMIYLNS